MPSADQQRQKLLTLLKELFQINQPDLDFGFYRIMHAKSEEVGRFLDKDLLQIIADTFGESSSTKQAELKKAYQSEIETARQYGAENPEASPKVKEAKARWEAAMDTSSAEAEVYDHLYRFFERYYDNGDFLSKRYYARESATKAAPYAVPYDGSEVYLHWANKDQYYIKTSEYFTDFTFDLSKSKEVEGQLDPLFANQDPPPVRVHFRIADATEGEHGNIKATNGQRRYFILHDAHPVSLENGELIIRFEYRPDPEKSGQDAVWQRKRMEQAVETIFKTVDNLKGAENFTRLLKIAAPTDKQKNRTLLAKYLARYTARNTMDYFIHKDLGGFLQRELDFYIKNEIMRLDDIENADAPRVEQYLSKIKVFRKIARKIIAFLAQLEEFQKKLWLKKKFVTETNYCITLDRVPEELYSEIITNTSQHDEWVRLFAIDEIDGDLHSPAYSKPLSLAFLKENQSLVVDTKFFDIDFKKHLLSSIESFDTNCDGILLHSENFQSLNFLNERYQKQVKCIYIDPPYNTDAGPINYKNGYRNSSWTSLLSNRISISSTLLVPSGIFCATIDDYQQKELHYLVEKQFGQNNLAGTVAIRINPSGRPVPSGFAQSHEYAIFAKASPQAQIGLLPRSNAQMARYKESDDEGPYMWELFRKRGSNSERKDRPSLYYPLYFKDDLLRVPEMTWDANNRDWNIHEEPKSSEIVFYPIDDNGVERTWRWNPEAILKNPSQFCAKNRNGNWVVYYKFRPNRTGVLPLTLWADAKYSATEHGTGTLKKLFIEYNLFSYPKSIFAVEDCISIAGMGDHSALCLDYFAGSGTTGHAVTNLNRKDKGRRKYILVEMGDYFDTVVKPRMAKVVYSDSWKDGKPTNRHTGISNCFKYLRLESYEDCLNNLLFRKDKVREKAVSKNTELREEYMLHYMLETETRGSQSLLNIDSFVDPTAYKLKVKKPGTDEYEVRNVVLMETFNYLIGLRVEHMDVPQSFTAKFKRDPDPELPKDKNTRLKLASRRKAKNGPWWFRKIEGWVPGDNGRNEKILIVWRKLTDDQEKDNLMLDEWFKTIRVNPRDFEFDTIYVNGSNNLPNLRLEGENWKVRLIEEDFMKRMWDVEDV